MTDLKWDMGFRLIEMFEDSVRLHEMKGGGDPNAYKAKEDFYEEAKTEMQAYVKELEKQCTRMHGLLSTLSGEAPEKDS